MGGRQLVIRETMRQVCRGKVFAALPVLLFMSTGLATTRRSSIDLDRVPHTAVRRADLRVVLRAGGQVESSLRTVIRCELENPGDRRSATTILDLLPEGSIVSKGDVLCHLDASEHEELKRLQLISLARARADLRRAELDLEVAKAALDEYRQGACRLEIQGIEGRIALAKSQVALRSDRLSWSRRMLAKGYISKAQVSSEAAALQRAEFALSQEQTRFRNFQDHEIPRIIRVLESDIASARSKLSYESLRLRAQEERLTGLQRQISACTIRAPHNGLLIYAHKPKREVRIEVGVWVRQNQELLYLPDLSRMEVQVLLHETVVQRVHTGMRARVRLESSPGFLEGKLSAIDPLPVIDRGKWSSGEVKNYLGRVQLDDTTRGLFPGMTAEVEIATASLQDVLVLPAEAPRRENGHDVCFVLGRAGLERRTVTLGAATDALWEVTGGVSEGEEVALAAVPTALPSEMRESGQERETLTSAGPKP